MKFSVNEIISFTTSADWLDRATPQIFESIGDDREFKTAYYVAIERFKALARRLGEAEVEVKGGEK